MRKIKQGIELNEFVQSLSLLSAHLTKWSNTLKLFVGSLPTNCLSVFDHFVGLAFKGFGALGRETRFTL